MQFKVRETDRIWWSRELLAMQIEETQQILSRFDRRSDDGAHLGMRRYLQKELQRKRTLLTELRSP